MALNILLWGIPKKSRNKHLLEVRGNKAIVELAVKSCVCTCRPGLCSLFALCPLTYFCSVFLNWRGRLNSLAQFVCKAGGVH